MNDGQETRKQRHPSDDSIECGIDLGTTNSLCAWVHYVDPEAKPPYGFQFAYHNQNDRITPSVVSVGPAGEILVGQDAIDNEVDSPTVTVRSIKRLMGRRFDEREVVKLKKKAAYQIGRDEAGMAVVVLGGKAYTPVEISAQILKKIKTSAEAQFGKRITHVVIAVPAYFDDAQINATRDAARQVGLVVKRIVSEPVAAVYAYGFGLTPGQASKVLVVDIGGGTTDVTVIRAAQPPPSVEMMHAGNMWLGGDDVDSKLVEAKAREIRKQFGVDPEQDVAFMAHLTSEVRRAKEVLCQGTRKTENLRLDRVIEATGSGGAAPARVRGLAVSHVEVEEAGRLLISDVMALVKQALTNATLTAARIDQVILVGGGSYLIGLDQALRQVFAPTQIAAIQDPIAAVALGCGILAKLIAGVQCKNKHNNDGKASRCSVCGDLLDPIEGVTPLPYGILVKGGGFAVVLEKSARMGVKSEAVTFFTTRPNQMRIAVPVYEGEDPIAENNRLQGYVIVQLSSPKPLNTPVEVWMSVNRDRLLEIGVSCDGAQLETRLKPGDWSTSLQREIEKLRPINSASEIIIKGESLLNDWYVVPPNSDKERRIERDGRELLGRLRDLEWESLLQLPLRLLKTFAGQAGPMLPYMDVLGPFVSEQVMRSLKQYADFQGGSAAGRREEVEQGIWDGIRAVFRNGEGKCWALMYLIGKKGSHDPDHALLANDLTTLDAFLRNYQGAGGNKTEALELLERARTHLRAVTSREYYKRAKEAWDSDEDTMDGLSRDPIGSPGTDTRAMRNSS